MPDRKGRSAKRDSDDLMSYVCRNSPVNIDTLTGQLQTDLPFIASSVVRGSAFEPLLLGRELHRYFRMVEKAAYYTDIAGKIGNSRASGQCPRG